MDNPEDLRQQALEEQCEEYTEKQYLDDTAKYKIGDIVGFIENGKTYIGVVQSVHLAKKGISGTNRVYDVICYNIITPTEITNMEEWELFSGVDYICRRYLKLPI